MVDDNGHYAHERMKVAGAWRLVPELIDTRGFPPLCLDNRPRWLWDDEFSIGERYRSGKL
jgi:hypothetical protein